MAHEKIGMDSTAGWMAYLSKAGNLLVKRFSVDPTRVYGEMLGQYSTSLLSLPLSFSLILPLIFFAFLCLFPPLFSLSLPLSFVV